MANVGTDTIGAFAPDGTPSIFASTGLSGPAGLAFDSTGNLYVSNLLNNTIVKFASNGSRSVFASTGLNGPDGIAFDSADNLYAVNVNNHSIEKFTPGGLGTPFITTGLSSPRNLAFDSAGNLYVADIGDGTAGSARIMMYASGSATGTIFANTFLNSPNFIAVSPGLLPPVPEPATWAMLCLGIPALIGAWRNRKWTGCHTLPPAQPG